MACRWRVRELTDDGRETCYYLRRDNAQHLVDMHLARQSGSREITIVAVRRTRPIYADNVRAARLYRGYSGGMKLIKFQLLRRTQP